MPMDVRLSHFLHTRSSDESSLDRNSSWAQSTRRRSLQADSSAWRIWPPGQPQSDGEDVDDEGGGYGGYAMLGQGLDSDSDGELVGIDEEAEEGAEGAPSPPEGESLGAAAARDPAQMLLDMLEADYQKSQVTFSEKGPPPTVSSLDAGIMRAASNAAAACTRHDNGRLSRRRAN